nr:immunoglobulin heavy chain junction region [Macaca mulatta]MOW93047.1 immunoglobulin heavy chain junction region [Macaca mulatta]
CARVQSNFDHW